MHARTIPLFPENITCWQSLYAQYGCLIIVGWLSICLEQITAFFGFNFTYIQVNIQQLCLYNSKYNNKTLTFETYRMRVANSRVLYLQYD